LHWRSLSLCGVETQATLSGSHCLCRTATDSSHSRLLLFPYGFFTTEINSDKSVIITVDRQANSTHNSTHSINNSKVESTQVNIYTTNIKSKSIKSDSFNYENKSTNIDSNNESYITVSSINE